MAKLNDIEARRLTMQLRYLKMRGLLHAPPEPWNSATLENMRPLVDPLVEDLPSPFRFGQKVVVTDG